jgi:multicomponent Na+:H+ antiporter subunit B
MRMSKIVRTATDILYPFIIIFGFYIILHGHLTPGGGFQGGAVVATGTALVLVAYSWKELPGLVSKNLLWFQESGGLLLFIGAGLAAMIIGFPFFYNWLAGSGSIFGTPVAFGPNPGDLNTGGFLPIMNIAVGVEVWGGLVMVLLYLLSALEREERA